MDSSQNGTTSYRSDNKHALQTKKIVKMLLPELEIEDVTPTLQPSRLLLLPGELFSKVIDFTMASTTPVHIELFIDMARNPELYQAEKERTTLLPWVESREEQLSRLPTTAPQFSRTWWLDLLPKTQVEHYVDWVAGNATCTRFRVCAKQAFFREKRHIASTSFLKALMSKKISHMSLSDQALAQHCIQHVIIPLSSIKAASFIRLPSISQAFANVRTMTLYMDMIPSRILQLHSLETPFTKPAPFELQDILNRLGFRSETMAVEVVLTSCHLLRDPERSLRVGLEADVYPILRTLLRIKSMPKPATKESQPSSDTMPLTPGVRLVIELVV
ncbi:MAG: hypothetical protein Q9213_001230 [Squamulea squamosa]